MICPFCRQVEIGNQPGPTIWPSCKTEFEIDVREESVFANIAKPRLPVKGIVCLERGLVKETRWNFYVNCGSIFNKTAHQQGS